MADLTTLAAAREFLQKQSAVAESQDPLTESSITRASTLIQNVLGREFAPIVGATRAFPYTGGGDVETGDLRSISSVIYDSEGAAVPIDAGAWHLRPAFSASGVYQSVYLTDYAATTPSAQTMVAITGDWGFAAVPADVEYECLITVRDMLRGNVAFNDTGDVQTFGNANLANRIRANLFHYMLPAV